MENLGKFKKRIEECGTPFKNVQFDKNMQFKNMQFSSYIASKKKTLFVFLFFSYSAVSHLRVVCESLSNVRYSQLSKSEVFLFYGFLF